MDGIRAVLDYGHENESDLISSRDSMGRLLLHYAAAGFDPTFEPSLSENALVQKVTSTF